MENVDSGNGKSFGLILILIIIILVIGSYFMIKYVGNDKQKTEKIVLNDSEIYFKVIDKENKEFIKANYIFAGGDITKTGVTSSYYETVSGLTLEDTYTFSAWALGYKFDERECVVETENNISKKRTICVLELEKYGKVNVRTMNIGDDWYDLRIDIDGEIEPLTICEVHSTNIIRLDYLIALEEVGIPQKFEFKYDNCYRIDNDDIDIEFKIIHFDYDDEDYIGFYIFDELRVIKDKQVQRLIFGDEDYDYGFENKYLEIKLG